MAGNFIYPFLKCLLWVEHYHFRWCRDVGQVRACISELRFLKMCLWWFGRCDMDGPDEKELETLNSMLYTVRTTWEKLVAVVAKTMEEFEGEQYSRERRRKIAQVLYSNSPARITDKEEEEEVRRITMDYEEYVVQDQDQDVSSLIAIEEASEDWNLEETIEECKLHIRGCCKKLLHCKFNYRNNAPSADVILKFLDAILKNLKALVSSLAGEVVPLEQQIETFEEIRLMLLHAYFKLVPHDCIAELRDFKKGLYDDINKLGWLTFLFWAKAGDEEIAAELNLVLSHMSHKIIKPLVVPHVSSCYFKVLKAMWLQRSEDEILLGQAVPAFVDLLFEYLGVAFCEDYEILRDGLIMLFTFSANPPYDYPKDEELFLIRDQLGDFLCQESHPIPEVEDTKKDSHDELVRLRNLIPEIERLKGKIRKLHNGIPDLSSCTFPRTNGLGFIDFRLQNLKDNLNTEKMFIPFAKSLMIRIQQELVFLRPNLSDIFEQLKDHKPLTDTWLRLINLAYFTEHVVNSCFVILDPIWYNMVCQVDILDEIKVIRGKLDTVKHRGSYNAVVPPNSVGSNGEMPERAGYSRAKEVMVGFEEEIEIIVDQVTRGPKSLEVVSIVGMGGSGKTTLVKKVYDTQQVRSRFHIFAFCTVSQVYSIRKLLLDILKDINVVIDDTQSKTDDDLAHMLHKQLSGKRYLIVLDDIWKIDAWEKVKSSLPDNNQGSRVILTTRESEVANKAKSKYIPHPKRLLSDEESWKLLQTKAFDQAGSSPNLTKIGKVIARNCKGLPLAVVLIARLLERNKRRLRIWNEIAEKTTSFASEEGCLDVLELSYKHLPEPLKSCFLYVGVFSEDELIPAKRLMLLWIAEGFIQKPQTQSVEDVAEQYLTELVDRSLVQVAKRSSKNGIKICKVHDVIRDFCLRKAQEENFVQLIHEFTRYKFSHSNRYRLCIHMDWESFVDAGLTAQEGIKSLLYHDKNVFFYECEDSKLKLSKFQLVQVLDLEKVELRGSKREVDKIIESMTTLVHLRYLAVSIMERNFEVPCSMANLKNLEICIFKGRRRGHRSWWGETLWKMKRLRHVDVGECWVYLYQPKLEAYPPLDNMDCFSTLALTCTTATTLLERLPNLRKLSCILNPDDSDTDTDTDSILAFDVLSKLESLELTSHCDGRTMFPATLKKLSLHGCKLSSQIGKLPRLEVLKIDGYFAQRWDVEDGEFQMLKLLKVKSSGLREWNVCDGSFPRLEQLVLVDCDRLKEIPASFGESTTLKRCEVRMWSPTLINSANEIRDEQKESGNEIELIISDGWLFSDNHLQGSPMGSTD